MLNSLPGEMGKKLSSAIAKSARSEPNGLGSRFGSQPITTMPAKSTNARGAQALTMVATWVESPMNDASLETNSEMGTVEAAPRRNIAVAVRLLNESIFARRSFESMVEGPILGRSKRGLARQDAATKTRDAIRVIGAEKIGKTKMAAQATKTAASVAKVVRFGSRHIRHRSS